MAAFKEEISAEEARERLRSAGLRSTSCRIAVLQHLLRSEQPLSHSEVADALTPLGFDPSTIFRCLNELADSALAIRLDVGDHTWRFEAGSGDATKWKHPHFLCVECGKIDCLGDVTVSITPARSDQQVGSAKITEVLLKGRCVECQ